VGSPSSPASPKHHLHIANFVGIVNKFMFLDFICCCWFRWD